MAVKLRMARLGRRHRPFFRLNAIESRNQRDGRVLEKLGHYDPLEKDADKQVVLNRERIEYWLGQGAVASETVGDLLAKHGMLTKHYEERVARRKRALAIARKAGKPFDETERKQAQKTVDEAAAKVEAEAKAKVEAEAKAKEEAEAKAKAEVEAAEAKTDDSETEEKEEAEAKVEEAEAKAKEEVEAKAKTEAEATEAKTDDSEAEEKAEESKESE